ncbi:MAG: hypothetical protein JXA82_19210 [Sedimentisphaerales bacterium]|nr:hypothetical protein [Sedimentisphaerales bacterium]
MHWPVNPYNTSDGKQNRMEPDAGVNGVHVLQTTEVDSCSRVEVPTAVPTDAE